MLLQLGKLVSTTDMKIAKQLNKVVKVSDIMRGKQASWVHQEENVLQMMVSGEYYEVASV